jgi:integrase/recombinase XerD
MSPRVRTLPEHHFAPEKAFPVKTRRAQDIVKAVANRAEITGDVNPHVLRHTFATTALHKGISLPTVPKILGHDRLPTTAIDLNFTDVPIPSRHPIPDEFERKGGERASPWAVQQTGRLSVGSCGVATRCP